MHNPLTPAETPRLGLCHNAQRTDTGGNIKSWAVSQHSDTAPARIPMFGLCQNTLTSAEAQKAWAVSQHTETEYTDIGKSTKGLGGVTTRGLKPTETSRLH